jgi:endogenous inhibitor of DNA gyrase (YacG/DUF329 family)
MIKRIPLCSVGVVLYEAKHTLCGLTIRTLISGFEGFHLGAGCGACGTVVWFDINGCSLTKDHWSLPGGGQRKSAFEAMMRRFFDSLPPCPACGKVEYAKRITSTLESPFSCPECKQAVDAAEWRDKTSENQYLEIYWYDENQAAQQSN